MIRLYVFYVPNMNIKLNLNKMLFNIQLINLFLSVIFYHKNLKLKHVINDIAIDL